MLNTKANPSPITQNSDRCLLITLSSEREYTPNRHVFHPLVRLAIPKRRRDSELTSQAVSNRRHSAWRNGSSPARKQSLSGPYNPTTGSLVPGGHKALEWQPM